MSRLVGILLAAGTGSRFGGDKLLVPLPDGVPMGVAAARLLRAALPHVIAVVRPGDDRLAELYRAEGLEVSACPEAHAGMGRSLAHGVAASVDATGWLIALADMPWIHPNTVTAVADALKAGAPLAAPTFDGHRGHPVGIAGEYRAELEGLSGDAGARHLLRRDAHRLIEIPCADPGILRDIDRPADLFR